MPGKNARIRIDERREGDLNEILLTIFHFNTSSKVRE
jgi:hypothetical protein